MPTGIYKRKPMSEETKRKIGIANSIALKGTKLSADRVEKIRERMKKNNPMKNESSRKKLSQSLMGIKRPKGELNHGWKGNEASYGVKHQWLIRNYGNAKKCEKCFTKTAKKYEWANVSGLYLRSVTDFIQLCASCHRKMDYTQEQRLKLSKSHMGQIPWNKSKSNKL